MKRPETIVRLEMIVSGGQTGVDRAALDAAMSLGIPCGGWCPKGRKAEDGRIPDRYPLREADSAAYRKRTILNVADSDGTLILARGELRGGTLATKRAADELKRPCCVVDFATSPQINVVRDWLRAHVIRILNVAGPRASQRPGLYRLASEFLRELMLATAKSTKSPVKSAVQQRLPKRRTSRASVKKVR